jgi:hypothetical protein
VKANPAILFLDQSGELGGAELCLADLAEFCRERCAVLLFQDGPFARLLRGKNIPVIIVPLATVAVRVGKSAGVFAYFRALPGISLLIYRAMRLAKNYDLLYANTAKALFVAAVLSFLLRKQFCFHLHDILDSDHFSALNRRLIVLLANRAQAVVANSKASWLFSLCPTLLRRGRCGSGKWLGTSCSFSSRESRKPGCSRMTGRFSGSCSEALVVWIVISLICHGQMRSRRR